jgi:hypothetical protein
MKSSRWSLALAALAAVFLMGCSTSRNYPGPVHGLTFDGTVQSNDIQKHRLTVVPLKSGEPVVFLWDNSTKFWKTGIRIDPESIERSWPVRIHYHETDGQLVAHHVYVQTSYPAVH